MRPFAYINITDPDGVLIDRIPVDEDDLLFRDGRLGDTKVEEINDAIERARENRRGIMTVFLVALETPPPARHRYRLARSREEISEAFAELCADRFYAGDAVRAVLAVGATLEAGGVAELPDGARFVVRPLGVRHPRVRHRDVVDHRAGAGT